MGRRLFRLGVVVAAVGAAVLGTGQVAVAEPTLAVSVSGARLASGGLQVVVTGRYVCGPFSPDSDGVVDLTVTQDSEPAGITGYGYVYLTVCDGSSQPYSAPVDSVNGVFVSGRVQVVGGGYACDRGPSAECVFGSFGPITVRVR